MFELQGARHGLVACARLMKLSRDTTKSAITSSPENDNPPRSLRDRRRPKSPQNLNRSLTTLGIPRPMSWLSRQMTPIPGQYQPPRQREPSAL